MVIKVENIINYILISWDGVTSKTPPSQMAGGDRQQGHAAIKITSIVFGSLAGTT